ncbi:hypothetical protein H0H81_012471 [Sphagnurus paluster]|uniref:Uncharacterized protein n=1 Tax=Sphagnurus paluster TaxID=117069 RepID=A0A9P7GU89_9AGAR|nr:hypothetical protein H0H81_012471 [Sphagnurus paluster]
MRLVTLRENLTILPGTAIYVFFILANFQGEGVPTETFCNFTLDGRAAGSFSHKPTSSPDLEYNALVFSRTNLSNTNHQLVVSTSGIADRNIFLNFDYAIYTSDDNSTTGSGVSGPTQSASPDSKNVSSTGIIVGAVIGGVAVLLGIILLLLFRRRRRQQPTPPQVKSFIIDEEDPPMANVTPASPNGPSTATTLPASGEVVSVSTSQLLRPQRRSDLVETATIASRGTHPGIPSFYGSDQLPARPASPSWTNSDVVDPSLARSRLITTNPSEGHDSGYGGGLRSEGSVYGGGSSIYSGVTTSTYRDLTPSAMGLAWSGTTAMQDARRDALRRARQAELDRQLLAVKREMHELNTDIKTEAVKRMSMRPPADQTREAFDREIEGAEMAEMREQMRLMREQIEFLQAQQISAWAQGLTDQAPPGYSAQNPNSLKTTN